jgi:hypothetical protein
MSEMNEGDVEYELVAAIIDCVKRGRYSSVRLRAAIEAVKADAAAAALGSAAADFGQRWQADDVPGPVVYRALRDRAAALRAADGVEVEA